MVEILVVIIAVGLIGSISVIMLSQGSEIFVSETNRQGFVSEARSAFWRAMRDTHGQASPTVFTSSGQNYLYLENGKGEKKEFQIVSPDRFNYRFGGTGDYNLLSNYDSIKFDRNIKPKRKKYGKKTPPLFIIPYGENPQAN